MCNPVITWAQVLNQLTGLTNRICFGCDDNGTSTCHRRKEAGGNEDNPSLNSHVESPDKTEKEISIKEIKFLSAWVTTSLSASTFELIESLWLGFEIILLTTALTSLRHLDSIRVEIAAGIIGTVLGFLSNRWLLLGRNFCSVEKW